MKKYMFTFCIFLFLFACKKEKITDVNPDFIGEWRFGKKTMSTQEYVRFDINSSSEGELIHRGSGEIKDKFTGIVRIKTTRLKIGTHSFEILDFPTLIDYSNGRDTIFVPFYSEPSNPVNPIIANWEMTIKSLSPFYPKDTWHMYRN